MVNYKGVYFGDDNDKFQEEGTGAHFRYIDICKRMEVAKDQRRLIDIKLNVRSGSQTPTSSQDNFSANLEKDSAESS